ncbi:MAG: class I SAM-dependent methyltransferase [Methanomassiliicoccales archaeon]
MRNKVLECMKAKGSKPSALDVGCGSGLVMELFSPIFDVKGIDIDPDMVGKARTKGLDIIQGDAAALPFEDNSFDVVYCSFTLLWVKDPQRMIQEMKRVSRICVVCLAEPDYGGRICHPKEVADLDRYLVESLIGEGADPFIGRKLGRLMEVAGLDVEMGVHSGVWSPDQLRNEAKAEWKSIADSVKGRTDKDELERANTAWVDALEVRSLFLFNPVFYAIGRK